PREPTGKRSYEGAATASVSGCGGGPSLRVSSCGGGPTPRVYLGGRSHRRAVALLVLLSTAARTGRVARYLVGASGLPNGRLSNVSGRRRLLVQEPQAVLTLLLL